MQQRMRSVVLAWALSAAWASQLPDPSMRVDFTQHGGDWTQGSCDSRSYQSPIDLNALFQVPEGSFSYFYNDVHSQSITLENDGRDVFINVTGQGFGGVTLPTADRHFFNLKKIVFKAASEHTLRGKHMPLEMQLIHQASTIEDPTVGEELLTVSILFDAETAPRHAETFPAGTFSSLQQPPRHAWQKTNGRRPQGFRPHAAQSGLFLQQPIPVEEVVPAAGGAMPVLDIEEPGSDPLDHERADADAETREADEEVHFTRSLLMGERRVQRAAAPAPAPGPAPFLAPVDGEPNHFPILNYFVGQPPPLLDDKVTVQIAADLPLQLGRFLHSGTFFKYRGSETVPPCKNHVTWLVRRERVLASDLQLKVMSDALYQMSNGNGNYRTSMPSNEREIEIVTGVEQGPVPLPMPSRSDWNDGRESENIPIAQDAITIAKAATDYARDFDIRLKRANSAEADAISNSLSGQTAALAAGTPPPASIPKAPLDTVWAAGKIAQAVKKTIQQAVEQDLKEVGPAAANLARSYLRQKLLAKVGFPMGGSGAAAGPLAAQYTTPAPTTTPMPSVTPCPH